MFFSCNHNVDDEQPCSAGWMKTSLNNVLLPTLFKLVKNIVFINPEQAVHLLLCKTYF